MQSVKTTLLILMCLTLLGACGLKGPLFLPGESPATAKGLLPASDVTKQEEMEGSKEKGSAPSD